MKKILGLTILSFLLLTGCGVQAGGVDLTKEDGENNQNENNENNDNGGEHHDGGEQVFTTILVDYLHDGGANIPTSWNDEDNENTVRTASYTYGENETFTIDFVGKWNNSTNKEEFQTKKSPVSYLRAASDVLVKKVVIEVFEADMKVYLNKDHTGEEVSKTQTNASHSDGKAYEYQINSKDWSILAYETYKGQSINIYSFTFYL